MLPFLLASTIIASWKQIDGMPCLLDSLYRLYVLLLGRAQHGIREIARAYRRVIPWFATEMLSKLLFLEAAPMTCEYLIASDKELIVGEAGQL